MKSFIIILNYNSFSDTADCIQSIFISGAICSIIVVDNNSNDDSLSRLQEKFSDDVEFIESQTNRGFAAGCNIGIEYALNQEADYILLLNNDTIVTPGFLESLIKTAESEDRIGLVGGKIFFEHRRDMLWDAGGIINWIKGNGSRRGGKQVDKGQFNEISEVEFVTGCMMLIKRKVIEEAGMLPEEYFFGVEEWDYGVNVKQHGWKLVYTPEAVIYHKVGGSHNDYDPKWYYNYLRGRMLFMKRNVNSFHYMLWILIFSGYLLTLKMIKLWKYYPQQVKKLFSTTFRAIFDTLRYNTIEKTHLNNV